ncbi:hypothetical protein B9K06_25600, partial [Bacillus sp. OG2]
KPLHELTRTKQKFIWTSDAATAFEHLKRLEENHLQLHAFRNGLPIKITTDASNVAVGVVLWQQYEDGWHPVIYRSQSLTPPQMNWSTGDKELYAIRFAVKKLRFYLHRQPSILIETDHKNLVNIFDKQDLTAKQSRWLEDMIGYNLVVNYIKGLNNEVADFLSRLPLYQAAAFETDIPLVEAQVNSLVIFPQPSWMQKIHAASEMDEFIQKVKNNLNSTKYKRYSVHPETNLLYFENRLVVPQELLPELLDNFHTSNLAGHPGINRMQAWLSQKFYFPRMTQIIHDYVTSCETCCRANAPNRTLGLLQAPEIPLSRWSHIAADIVSGFTPVTFEGRTVNAVLVIVDIFSSHVHFHLLNTKHSGTDLIQILLHHH